MTEFASRPMQDVSGGTARLVAFCMAVAAPGAVLVLDEPTNDVDPLRRRTLWELVRETAETGAALLLVTPRDLGRRILTNIGWEAAGWFIARS